MIYHDFSCRECLLNSDNLNGGMSGLTEQKIQAIIANMWREKVVCLGQQWCPCWLRRGPSRNHQETPMKDGKAKLWIKRDMTPAKWSKEASACFRGSMFEWKPDLLVHALTFPHSCQTHPWTRVASLPLRGLAGGWFAKMTWAPSSST